MVFGTFDGIHAGHLDLFRQAKEYGDPSTGSGQAYLIVVVGRDVNIEKIKGYLPKNSEIERFKEVQKNKLVNEALLGNKEDPYKIIEQIKPDIICLGYDQKYFAEDLEKELKNRGLDIKIFRMKPFEPEKYHSSIINKK